MIHRLTLLALVLSTAYPVINAQPYPVGTPNGAFSVTPSGAAYFAIDIDMPVGVGGMQPALSINYNSQSGDGLLGVGCALAGISSITRGPKDIYHDGFAQGISYDASDALYLDGIRLILNAEQTNSAQTVYTVESDPFTEVALCSPAYPSGSYFRVTASDGMTYEYGNTVDSRFDISQGITYTWYLNKATDSRGNYITYSYMHSDNYVYPSGISYGMNESGMGVNNAITFTYEDRVRDARPFYIHNTHGSITKRLKTITTSTAAQVYRVYDLAYNDQNDNHSRLVSVTERNSAGEALRPVELTWDYLQADSRTPRTPSIQLPATATNVNDFISQDLNGDGIDDIIMLEETQGTDNSVPRAHIFLSNTDASSISYSFRPSILFTHNGLRSYIRQGVVQSDFDGDGMSDLAIPFLEKSGDDRYDGLEMQFVLGKEIVQGETTIRRFSHRFTRSGRTVSFLVSDFNNDGKSEILCLEGEGNNGYYESEYARFQNGLTFNSISVNLYLPDTPQSIQQGDFNSDGLTDIIVFFEDGYRIYFNRGVEDGEYPFSYSSSVGGTTIQYASRIYSGDFNGDGAHDFFINAYNSHEYYFALGHNDGTFTRQLALYSNDFLDSRSKYDDDKFTILVTDFNNDGRSDVIMGKACYDYDVIGGSDYENSKYAWFASNGNSLNLVRQYNVSNDEYGPYPRHFMLGNFTGIGKPEILSYGRDITDASSPATPLLRIIDSGYTTSDGKVTAIVDGMGHRANISYATITDPQIYTKGTGAQYPIQDCQYPLHVVSSVSTSFGTPSMEETHYTYGGLKAHQQGKGLLCFTTVVTNNVSRGIRETQTCSNWDDTHLQPLESTILTEQGGTTRRVTRYTTIVDYSDNNYKQYEDSVITCDIYGNLTRQTSQYDNTRDCLTSQKTLDVSTGSYKQTTYSGFQYRGGKYVPTNVVLTQKHSDDSDVFEQQTRYTYTDEGLVATVIENALTPKSLQTTYTYDCFGNKLTETVRGTDIPTQQTSYAYSASRFMSRVQTQPAATDIRYTYDMWGNVLTESDHTYGSVLQTRYEYDGWGTLVHKVSPEGVSTSISLSRAGILANAYDERIETDGSPWILNRYDDYGRKVMTESIGPNGVQERRYWTYNTIGQLLNERQIVGSLNQMSSFSYDEFGRKSSETNPTGQVYNYSYGNRSETIETDGYTTIRTYDAWGNLKSSSDPVSSVSYTYGSNGKPRYVRSGGATWEFEYDDAGNKTLLADPDAGVTEYEYDALGRIVYLRDARGIETETEYDAQGHIVSTTIDGEVTTYTYGSTGNGKMRLISESNVEGTASYSYDSLGRVISTIRSLTGTGAYNIVTYSYNDLNQLSSKTINGQCEEYTYDANGYKVGSSVNGQNVWQMVDYNGSRMTKLLGDSLTSITEYDVNGVTRMAVLNGEETITDISYEYTESNGNIASRIGMLDDEETFAYDELDRLISVSVDDQTILEMTYADNGNLTDKTGLGSITYSSARPHAVSLIEHTPSDYYAGLQTTAYNALNKIERIAQDNKIMTFVYGPDCSRWKSAFTSGSSTRTILYGNDYERITDNSGSRHFHYLDEGAILITTAGQPAQLLFSCTDNLGSIVKLVDNQGYAYFEASYDVWGKQTVTRNEIGFHRGYTGHEMLPTFNLINMNGRLYDPVIGRFLSPDNFVQIEDFSQNFNRYSYCLNNPLKYTDPSGEIFGLIGGLFRGLTRLFTKGDFLAPITESFNGLMNDIKLLGGWFQGTSSQIVSRFTTEIKQTVIGFIYSDFRQLFSEIDGIYYYDGATFIVDETNEQNGVTLGSFININTFDKIPLDDSGRFMPYKNELYMHEYGHYLQSQDYGIFYIGRVGLPSLLSASLSREIYVQDKNGYYWRSTTHRFSDFEKNANSRAYDYFHHHIVKKWDEILYPFS